MPDNLNPPDWRAVPGLTASAIIFLIVLIGAYNSLEGDESAVDYLFGVYSAGDQFWTLFMMSVMGISTAYSVKTERKSPRYALATAGGILIVTELRFDINAFTTVVGVLLAVFLLSVLLFEVSDTENAETSADVVELIPRRPFESVALVSCTVLFVGVVASVVSVLFGVSPLLGDLAGSRIGVVYLVGSEEVHDEARSLFRAVIVSLVFVTVVADAVRNRELRWLSVVALVVSTGGASFFCYYTLWTATVAAVGALLTVIVLALVLDERTEATLS